MDMDMGSSSSPSSGMYLHTKPGDTILFQGWMPTKTGPIVGACIGLFLLAVLQRWLSALRRLMELWWAEHARALLSRRIVNLDKPSPSLEEKGDPSLPSSVVGTCTDGTPSQRDQIVGIRPSFDKIPPFIASHDFTRGILVVFDSAITYALMLVVMTFNGGFIASILLGLGAGEVLFGRLAFTGIAH